MRIESRWVERAIGSNKILLYLAGVTLGLSAVAGILMHWINPEAFPTVGIGIWWAVVTFCTVGYGDYVPTDTLGRLVAGLVMVFAITFIAVVTALVTSTLVTQAQRRQQEAEDALAGQVLLPMHEGLARLEERLDRIEQRLS